jgi:LCP family protein required for cell wall assembly
MFKKIIGTMFVLGLGALIVWLAPALPMLSRFAALPIAPKEPVTILVAGVGHHYVGYHTRGTINDDFTKGLTDTMIVVQLNPQQKALKILNVPRDTRVGTGFTSNDKINAANVQGGPVNSVRQVEALLGVKLDGYLFVSIDGTRELVDALGGVEVYVPQRMQYRDRAAKLEIDLHPGKQVLMGRQAEGYLRFRYDNLGDIGRVQRQQAFYRAMLEKFKQPQTWTRLPQIVQVIEQNTRTNLSNRESGAALGFLLSGPRLDTLLLPGNFGLLYGVSYWVPDRARIEAMTTNHLRGAAQQNARSVRELSIAVVNTTNIRGLARAAQSRLRALGFRNVWVADSTTGDPARTQVFSTSSADEARIVRTAMGVGESLVSSEGILGADITVRVGRDFKPDTP